jgi:hypothetical protein
MFGDDDLVAYYVDEQAHERQAKETASHLIPLSNDLRLLNLLCTPIATAHRHGVIIALIQMPCFTVSIACASCSRGN